MYTSLPRGVPRCHHVRINGTRCDSPALKGKAYCYFHHRSRQRESAPVAPNSQLPNHQLPTTGYPAPLSPPADLFLLEDANSIQSALQWVLRRILAASIDRRQASLLLYGLQIAAANVKQTTFEPYYKKVIRDLPAAQTAITASSENAHEPAQNCLDCHPEPGPREIIDRSGQSTAGSGMAEGRESPAESPTAFPDSPPPLPPGSPERATDNCPLATISSDSPEQPTAPIRRNRKPRRPRPASIDTRMLSSTPRAALSLMFQREIKRHLAHLDFPASPQTDTET
jgi:hypothetical protein